jgi:hypothetical protein
MLHDENKTPALLVALIFVSAPPFAFRARVAVHNSLFFYRTDICGVGFAEPDDVRENSGCG